MVILIAKVFSSAQKPQQLLEQCNYTVLKVFPTVAHCTFHSNGVLRFAEIVKTSRFVPQLSCLEAFSLFGTLFGSDCYF